MLFEVGILSDQANIKLVNQPVTLEDVEELLQYYQDITSKTGIQLGWEYKENAFPYKMEKIDQKYIVLSGCTDGYHKFYIGIENNHNAPSIFIKLSKNSTHGDKGKAVEFSKFIAKKLSGELHLFNGRIMYFYKR